MSKLVCVFVLICCLKVNCQKLSEVSVSEEVELHIQIDGQDAGKLRVGLFGDVVPKTVANFVGICKSDKTNKDGRLLSYQETPFHRIIPNFMLQTGDFTQKNGMGGESIYGNKFKDENFLLKHEKYCLSMANAGPDTNGSQFFITVAETSWLDGKHVVFGKLMDQSSIELAKAIEALGSNTGTPKKTVIIRTCLSILKQDL